jgi:hypothetical protein
MRIGRTLTVHTSVRNNRFRENNRNDEEGYISNWTNRSLLKYNDGNGDSSAATC